MSVLEESGLAEKQQAERLITQAPLLKGVERVEVELGNDQTGDPAMWLIFHLDKTLDVSDDFIRTLNDYAATLQTKILHSGLTRFPYIRLEQSA